MSELVRKPFMPPSRNAIREASVAALARTVIAHCICKIEGGHLNKIAARMFPGDRDVEWLIRGAVGPTTTSSAASLLKTLTPDFIASLSPVSAGAIFLPQTLQLRFDGAAMISVPTFIADAANASFVGESFPIPVAALAATSVTLEPSKLARIVTLTSEIVTGSNAQALVTDALMRSFGLALDSALFDANPAVADTRPAGLRHNISAETASTETDGTAMIADISTLIGAVAPVAGNVPPVLIASPARARTMPLRAPGGLPLTVLPSSAVAANDLIAIAPNAVVSATGAAPQVFVSGQPTLHQDTAPAQIGTVGTPNVVAAPTVSLFQSDLLAVKVRMEATWARRTDAAVAWLTATAW